MGSWRLVLMGIRSVHRMYWRASHGSNFSWRSRLLPAPPQHQFQPAAVGVGARDPFRLQIKVRTEPVHQLLARRSKGRAILVGNQIVDCQIMSTRVNPAQDGPHVVVAPRRVDGAKERVLENPVKRPWRCFRQKIAQDELGGQVRGGGLLLREPDGAGGEVAASHRETVRARAGRGRRCARRAWP